MRSKTCAWIAVLLATASVCAGVEAVWNQTATTPALKWDLDTNWTPNDYPNGVGDTAIVTQSLGTAINLLIGLYETTTTVSRLVLGNTTTSPTTPKACELRSSAVEKWLAFRGVGGAPAIFEVYPGAVALTETMNAYVALHSDLVVTNNGVQAVSWSTGKILDVNGKALTFNGTGTGAMNLTANVVGSGAITNNAPYKLAISGVKSYTGTLSINQGLVDLPGTASFRNATDTTISGYFTYGGTTTVKQWGGVMSSGNNNPSANPGQRFPWRTITLNGGSLHDDGQLGNGTWTTEVVRDTVSVMRCNSGYSYVYLNARTPTTAGTTLDVGTLERAGGATLYARGMTFASTAKLLFGNGSDFLVGAGGAAGTQTRSIIPWIAARNDGTATATPDGFATYDATTGLRALYPYEYTNSITAGATRNVSCGNFTFVGNVTVNALRFTGNTCNMGAGSKLTISSGSLIQYGTVLGAPGNAAAGTIDFGGAEGIIWCGYNTTPTNTIGAVLAGSGGLTKASAGPLAITGGNTYTGPTTVGCGKLIVGDATYGSNLGDGDVLVADGGLLEIRAASVDAIDDGAAVRLGHFGVFYGRLDLNAGVNETVKHLYLGGVARSAGTYGSTASSATHKNDSYFAGTGVLTVTHAVGVAPVGTVLIVQ